MNASPHTHQFSSLVNPVRSLVGSEHKGKRVTNPPEKQNVDFRDASRREDANLIWAAFPGPSQDAVALKCSQAIGTNPRTIIRWMQMEHDMPSWAVKAVKHYIRGVERIASRIEGK